MLSFSSTTFVSAILLLLCESSHCKKSLLRGVKPAAVASDEEGSLGRFLQKGKKKDPAKGKKGKKEEKKGGKKGGKKAGDGGGDGGATALFSFMSALLIGADEAGNDFFGNPNGGDYFELRRLTGSTATYGDAYLQFGPFESTVENYESEVVQIDPNDCYLFVGRDRHNGEPFGYPPSEVSFNGGPFAFCTGECIGCGGDIETCEVGNGCARRRAEGTGMDDSTKAGN